MDTDGDGVLSMFELEYFYEEQCERMERMGIEPLPFQDLLCQMLDLVKPEIQGEHHFLHTYLRYFSLMRSSNATLFLLASVRICGKVFVDVIVPPTPSRR